MNIVEVKKVISDAVHHGVKMKHFMSYNVMVDEMLMSNLSHLIHRVHIRIG